MPRSKSFDKEEVLHKAMHLFWRKGFYNTSIQDLVAELGINRASLYDTFGGKRQLFEKVFERYCTVNNQGFEEHIMVQTNVRVALRMAFEHLISQDYQDAECKGCFIVNTTTEMLPEDDTLQTVISGHGAQMEQAFLTLLQRGEAQGQIPPGKDLKTLAKLLYTLMQGLRVVGKTRPQPEETMASVDAVLSLLD